jgi:4'-phosphopantetheinyl transferase
VKYVSALICDVWFAESNMDRPALRALLDKAEVARREAFFKSSDKAQFTVGAALLRLIASHEIGTRPERLLVDRSCNYCSLPHGKPRIVGADLHVSKTHSDGTLAIALTRVAPIGVDLEVVTSQDIDELALFVLAPEEQALTNEDFFIYWSRKESLLKAIGIGLQVPMHDIKVSAAHEPAELISYRSAPMVASMQDLDTPRGYVGALTVLAQGCLEIHFHNGAAFFS